MLAAVIFLCCFSFFQSYHASLPGPLILWILQHHGQLLLPLWSQHCAAAVSSCVLCGPSSGAFCGPVHETLFCLWVILSASLGGRKTTSSAGHTSAGGLLDPLHCFLLGKVLPLLLLIIILLLAFYFPLPGLLLHILKIILCHSLADFHLTFLV